ncbi:MAG: hypothetical protein ABIJ47_00055 [Candidatus Bathyarchaeota archaeon]
MKKDRRLLLVFLLIALLAVGWIALTPIALAGLGTEGSNAAEASTPYGESLAIKIGSGTKTSGTASLVEVTMPSSWLVSYSDGDTQNVYEVNSTYKEQEQVTMSYTLAVTYANVDTIAATVKVKAIDKADASYYEYTIANAKSISGASPINDNGNVQKAIATHLTEITASTTSASVKYQIYCQVTAEGTVSGETLTATVAYTDFGCLAYARSTESSSAEVTPQVSVATWVENRANNIKFVVSVFDTTLGLPEGSALTIVAILSVAAAAVLVVVKRR